MRDAGSAGFYEHCVPQTAAQTTFDTGGFCSQYVAMSRSNHWNGPEIECNWRYLRHLKPHERFVYPDGMLLLARRSWKRVNTYGGQPCIWVNGSYNPPSWYRKQERQFARTTQSRELRQCEDWDALSISPQRKLMDFYKWY